MTTRTNPQWARTTRINVWITTPVAIFIVASIDGTAGALLLALGAAWMCWKADITNGPMEGN